LTPEEYEAICIFAALLIVFALIWFSLRIDSWHMRRMIREEVKREIQNAERSHRRKRPQE
jgi:flagellar biosynthesis protein FlhB